MPQKLGEITGEQMLGGVFPDLPHKEPAFFKNSRNVMFSDKAVQPISGQYVLTATSGGLPVRGLLSLRNVNTPILFYGDDEKLYRYTISGGTTVVGSGFSGNGAAWSLRRWGSWVFATNGVNAPQVYKGASFAPMAGHSSVFGTAKFFLPYKNYLLAMNTDVNDSRIAWCTADDPEVWAGLSTNTARLLDIRDTTSGISAGLVSNERIYYWTLKSMSVMGFQGPPNIFSSNFVTDDIGAFGPLAVTDAMGAMYGIGPNGAWRTDGSSIQYIDEGAVHDELFSNINLDMAHKCVAFHDVFTKHIVYWIPGVGESEVSYGLAYNYKENNWAPRGDARSAALESGDFQWGILGDTRGNVYAQSLVGAPISAQDPNFYVRGEGVVTIPFGMSGFGQGGVGGMLTLTE